MADAGRPEEPGIRRRHRVARRPSHRLRLLTWSLGGSLIVLGALVSLLHLPPVQRLIFDRLMLPALERSTGLTISVDMVSWNLLGLRVDLAGVRARARDADKSVLTLAALHARLPLRSLLGTWTFDVELQKPE